MLQPVRVIEVYETDGGGMGHNLGTLGVFETEEKARAAAQKLGHPFFGIQDRYAIIDGKEVYLISPQVSFAFGKLKKRAR